MTKPVDTPVTVAELSNDRTYPKLRDLGPTLIATAKSSLWPLWVVFYITFPIMLGLKVVEEFFPITTFIGSMLEPSMQIVGLPGEAGLAWAASILIQPISAFAILADTWDTLNLTVAQATIFGILVLEVHAIFVEMRISHMLGVRMWFTTILRFATAFAMGFIFDQICKAGGWLQQPATLLIEANIETAQSWSAWWIFQAKTWALFAVLFYGLSLLMKAIRAFHIERFFIYLLSPVMRMMGIHKNRSYDCNYRLGLRTYFWCCVVT